MNENNTEDSDDDDDDAFTIRKRSFQGKNTTVEVQSPARNLRKRQLPIDESPDEILAEIQRKSRETRQQIMRKAEESSDSDSDDGSEAAAQVGTAKMRASSSLLLQPATNPIDLLDTDSSDDDDDKNKHPLPIYSLQAGGASEATCQTLLKARTAKLELQLAQQYHAEDVYVPPPLENPVGRTMFTPIYVGLESVNAVTTLSSQTTSQLSSIGGHTAIDLGPSLQITLRSVHLTLDGKKPNPVSEIYPMKRKEQFQALLGRFLSSKGLTPAIRVVMKFDGQKIDMNKTPANYDMEDEDMIDCEITGSVTAAPETATQPPQGGGGGGRLCQLKLVTSTKKRSRHS